MGVRTVQNRKAAITRLPYITSSPNSLAVHRTWAVKLHTAILNYTKAANMTLVSRVMNLPRELRNAIYMHLWVTDGRKDPSRDLVYWWDSFDEPWFIIGDDLNDSPWITTNATDLRPPHFVDHSFVGRLFAKEVLLQFKDTVGKDLREQDTKLPVAEFALTDESMMDFAEKDAFGVGLSMHQVVQNLDLRINFECDALIADDTKENDTDEENHGVDEGHCLQSRHVAQLENGVKALLSMPYSDRVIVRDGLSKRIHNRRRMVTLVLRQEDSFHVRESLPVFLKLVNRASCGLRNKGFDVKVQYRSEEIGFNVAVENDARAWTSDEWNDNFSRRNVSRVEQQAHFHESQIRVWNNIKSHMFDERPCFLRHDESGSNELITAQGR